VGGGGGRGGGGGSGRGAGGAGQQPVARAQTAHHEHAAQQDGQPAGQAPGPAAEVGPAFLDGLHGVGRRTQMLGQLHARFLEIADGRASGGAVGAVGPGGQIRKGQADPQPCLGRGSQGAARRALGRVHGHGAARLVGGGASVQEGGQVVVEAVEAHAEGLAGGGHLADVLGGSELGRVQGQHLDEFLLIDRQGDAGGLVVTSGAGRGEEHGTDQKGENASGSEIQQRLPGHDLPPWGPRRRACDRIHRYSYRSRFVTVYLYSPLWA